MILQKQKLNVQKRQLELIIQHEINEQNVIFKKLHYALKKLIMEKKRNEICKKILQEDYFYHDPNEQEQIIQMLQSILTGKRKDLYIETDFVQLQEKVDDAIIEVLQLNTSFSFDAFLTFRLRFYVEKFPTLLETAIDEYKLEQEYQMFIHFLRGFLTGRKSQMDCVYIINEEDFIFLDEKKQQMKRSDLNRRIDRKLISNHPIYVDSTTIAPLISLAPKQIFLYTNNPDQGIIQTLKNVFEEKLIVLPLQSIAELKKMIKNPCFLSREKL